MDTQTNKEKGYARSQIADNQGNIVIFQGSKGIVIIPSDTDLIEPSHLYIGTQGDVAVLLKDDKNSIIFKNVPVGTFIRLLVIKVLSTGTSASNIIAYR